MRLPFSVQVFLVRLIDGEMSFLLLQRNARPELALPSFWQGVSGALEPGESFAAAALREVAEETGIVLKTVNDTGFSHCYPVRAEWRMAYGPEPLVVEEHVFYALLTSPADTVLSAEHQSSRWCSTQEAASLLTFGANAACLQAVCQAMATRSQGM